jgi:hypothetical protein
MRCRMDYIFLMSRDNWTRLLEGYLFRSVLFRNVASGCSMLQVSGSLALPHLDLKSM